MIKKEFMEKYKIYKIHKEEKVEDIAKKFNISVKDIKRLNPNTRFFNYFFSEYVSALQEIKIPIFTDKEKINDILEEQVNNFHFDLNNRYRYEQTNITRINSVVTSHVNQKAQVILRLNLKERRAKIEQEDLIYKVSPPLLSSSFELVKETEFIKNNVLFELSDKGKIDRILNKNELLQKWKKFRNNEFRNLDFIKSLKDTPESITKLENIGNHQFSTLPIKEYQNSLFNFIYFDQYLYHSCELMQIENFEYLSTILPPIVIPVEFRFDKIKETEDTVIIKKIGMIKLTKEITNSLITEYDKLLKPTIKFGFTEFKLLFNCVIEFNPKTKVIEYASAHIKEEIADNIENSCEFTMNRLHNYTP